MKNDLNTFLYLREPITLLLTVAILSLKIYSVINKRVFFRLILHPQGIHKRNEYFRLLTGDLVHHDWMHLLLNEFLLIIYGGSLENYLNIQSEFGSVYFAGIYFVSSLTGSIATTFFHRNEFGFTSGGASASIMGCMFSLILLQPKKVALYLPGFGAVTNLVFGLICIVLLFVYRRRTRNELINYEQHFFGALGGIAITLILFPAIIK